VTSEAIYTPSIIPIENEWKRKQEWNCTTSTGAFLREVARLHTHLQCTNVAFGCGTTVTEGDERLLRGREAASYSVIRQYHCHRNKAQRVNLKAQG
jgi:hypothetical protein